MYKVIEAFIDLKDGNHAYAVGDEYPREGLYVREARVLELLGENKRNTAYIEEVSEDA